MEKLIQPIALVWATFDGPLLIRKGPVDGMKYERGVVAPPSADRWG